MGWGEPHGPTLRNVKGKCPACGGHSLFLGVGDYVTCGYIPCPNPHAASDLLDGKVLSTEQAANRSDA